MASWQSGVLDNIVMRTIEEHIRGNVTAEIDGMSDDVHVYIRWWQGGEERFTIKAGPHITQRVHEEADRRRKARMAMYVDRPATYHWLGAEADPV